MRISSESFSSVFPGTVADNLGVVPTLGGEATAADVSVHIAEVLRLVELGSDFGDRIAADLSGGESSAWRWRAR